MGLCQELLLFVFVVTLTTLNGRSLESESPVDLIQESVNSHATQILASYRHRFTHSPNFKALRWALGEEVTPPYCDICHLFIPLVSPISSSRLHPFVALSSGSVSGRDQSDRTNKECLCSNLRGDQTFSCHERLSWSLTRI